MQTAPALPSHTCSQLLYTHIVFTGMAGEETTLRGELQEEYCVLCLIPCQLHMLLTSELWVWTWIESAQERKHIVSRSVRMKGLKGVLTTLYCGIQKVADIMSVNLGEVDNSYKKHMCLFCIIVHSGNILFYLMTVLLRSKTLLKVKVIRTKIYS